MTSKKTLAVIILILSFVLSISLFVFRDNFRDFQSLGIVGIFLINFVSSATFFVSGPAFLTVIAGGAIYPPLLVAFIASLGASFGDMVSYFFGLSGRHLTEEKLKKKLWFIVIEQVFTAYGKIIVFIFAFIPNPLFDGIGLLAGIMGMKYVEYFAIMLSGRLLRYIVLAFIGAKFD